MATSGALDTLSTPRIMRQNRSEFPAMDLGGWLRRLGLEQYGAAFREDIKGSGMRPENFLHPFMVSLTDQCRGIKQTSRLRRFRFVHDAKEKCPLEAAQHRWVTMMI